jgi:hypothetical protein
MPAAADYAKGRDLDILVGFSRGGSCFEHRARAEFRLLQCKFDRSACIDLVASMAK